MTEDGETGERQEVGFRLFEGAAGGAVMTGDPPDVSSFREHFDRPDALINLPYGSSDVADLIADLIADLDRQPDWLMRISRENSANALRRHDWLYRWRRVLEVIGLPVLSGLKVREKHLQQLACNLTGRESGRDPG